MIIDILLTALLVFLNGFFVAAEFAIVKVRSSQVELKAGKGSYLAKISKNIVDKLDSYLSACQLGITMASLALGWIGESVVSRMILVAFSTAGHTLDPVTAHQVALPSAFILITVLHIVFGEQVPKIFAIRHSLATTLVISLPLRIFYFLLRPFIWFLNAFSNLILRITPFQKFNYWLKGY